MIKTPLSTMIGGAFWTPSATILGSASKTFNQLIKSLFANGEQGFAYDPNDLSTMFQGTVPVTAVGQPVGLILDKSKGLVLGDNIIKNGNFDNLDFWLVTDIVGVDVAGNKLTLTRYVDSDSVSQQLNTDIGGYYEVEVSGIPTQTGNARVSFGPINSIISSQNTTVFSFSGKKSFIFKATTTTSYLLFGASSNGAVIEYSNISVKKVSGNHAYQTTSSMRPLLTASPQRLYYDTVDDKLITALPAQLTGCTVVRAVPNIGTQILTNQTIPTPYEDNQDHCGLIVINRALTPSETSAITTEFNKRAGV
jgi:hypothetical protein